MIIKPCENCGKPCKVPPTRVATFHYCSKVCLIAARSTPQDCEQCGKSFKVINARVGRSRFCSKACLNIAIRANETEMRICPVCQTPFTSPVSKIRGHLTCSPECARKAKGEPGHLYRGGPKAAPKIEKPCAICGATMYLFKCRGDRLYCSRKCAGIGNGQNTKGTIRNSRPMPCAYCGTLVMRPESRIKAYKLAFCDKECFHAWDKAYKATPEMIERLAVRLAASSGKSSSIEERTARWLADHGISFERQVLLGHYVMDFKIGGIYLEVNGCYWHGCADHYPAHTPIQKRRIGRDKGVATYCRNRNIPLLTIWEHDIDNNDFTSLSLLKNSAAHP